MPPTSPPAAAPSSGRRSSGAHDIPLARSRLCVVDLETTGGAPGEAKITEIGAVLMEGLRVVDRFSALVDPGTPVPYAIQRLTGITDEMLRGAPPIEIALGRFLDFSDGAPLVAHNAPFDLRFLNYERRRVEGRFLDRPCLDTLLLARRLLAGRVARYGLSALADWADVTTRPSHRALPDAEATAEVLVALIELLPGGAATTLGQALALAAAPRDYSQKQVLADGLPAVPGLYVMRASDGEPLAIVPSANLRRHAQGFLRPGRRHGAQVVQALDDLDRIDHEPTGSVFEARLRALELQSERSPRLDSVPLAGCYLVLRAVAGGCRVEVVGRPAPGESCVGPLASRRSARAAARALNAIYLAPGAATSSARAHALMALLAGDARELSALPGRIANAAAVGRFDPGRLGERSPRALLATLAALARTRSLAGRAGVVVEPDRVGRTTLFCVAGGAVVARHIVRSGRGAPEAARALEDVARAEAAEPVPLDLYRLAQAELVDRRWSGRARPPGDLVLGRGWSFDGALAELSRSLATGAGGSVATRVA